RLRQAEKVFIFRIFNGDQLIESSGIAQLESGAAQLRTQRARAHIRCNLEEPRPARPRPASILETAPRVQLRDLKRILCFLVRSQPSQAVLIDAVRVAGEELGRLHALGCRTALHPTLLDFQPRLSQPWEASVSLAALA